MEKEVIKYAEDINLPVSPGYLRKIILGHPDYPSIISIVDAFNTLGVECIAAQKPLEEMKEIPFPYLVHAEPTFMKYVRNDEELEQAKRNHVRLSGIMIKIEPTATINDPAHNKAYRRERLLWAAIISITTLFAALVLVPILSGLLLISALYSATAFAGIAVVVLLKIREYGLHWERLEAFCMAGTNADCDSVITSTGSKVFGFVKLTDAALAYFVWQLLILSATSLLPGFASFGFTLIETAAVASTSVVAYSIIYQWRVVGKWCKFCLMLGAVCLLQAAVSVAFWSGGNAFQYQSISALLLFGFLLAVFTIVSMIEDQNQDLDESNIYLKRIFSSPHVFFELLQHEPTMTDKSSRDDIVLGNPDAGVTLTAVLNILCRPCKEAFEHLYEFIKMHKDNVRVVIKLTSHVRSVPQGSISQDQYLIGYWMKHIKGKASEQADTLEFLNTWYKNMDISWFRKIYNYESNTPLTSVIDFINNNDEWIKSNPIDETPTFFLNNRKIPRAYRIKELTSVFGLILAEIGLPVHEVSSLDQVEV